MEASHAYRFSTAPMVDWSDTHCRYFFRLFCAHMQIYTEMLPTPALIHGPRQQLLDYHPMQKPLVLQLGGSDPAELAFCSKLGAQWNYDEINLNLGCPSPRVRKGGFGAALMQAPQLVAHCLKAMHEACNLPISLKCRLGVDAMDSDQALLDFLGTMADAGCKHWVIHSRIARLDGLSPKENRTIPPLNYDRVHLVKQTFPDAIVIINGGFDSPGSILPHLTTLDGGMLGRAAYQNPQVLAQVDSTIFGDDTEPKSVFEIAQHMTNYIRTLQPNAQRKAISHTFGLFNGYAGAKAWRRMLSEGMSTIKQSNDPSKHYLDLWQQALEHFQRQRMIPNS